MLSFCSLFQNHAYSGPKLSLRVPFKALALVEGEKSMFFTCCIEGREPDILELCAFADDGIRKVHPYSWVQISNNFIGETFHTHFFNAREIRIPFLGRRYVNGSVQWIDVPRLFGKTGIATVAWTENTFVKL